MREPPGRPAHPAAYVQDVMVGAHTGRVCKGIDGICAAIVILVEVL
jgi:hypothetical protein